MQVHYDEGVAIHIGPEPCVGVREDGDEASVGEGIGQPLSRESQSPGADAVSSAEGNTFRTHHRKVRTTRRGRRTWHVQTLFARPAILAGKPTNKAVSTAAEPVERRAEAKGNASQQSTRRTQSRVSVSHALERIRQTVTKNALPSHTQGGSRMPELGPYGSVRGALSNERPYRDIRNPGTSHVFEIL